MDDVWKDKTDEVITENEDIGQKKLSDGIDVYGDEEQNNNTRHNEIVVEELNTTDGDKNVIKVQTERRIDYNKPWRKIIRRKVADGRSDNKYIQGNDISDKTV